MDTIEEEIMINAVKITRHYAHLIGMHSHIYIYYLMN